MITCPTPNKARYATRAAAEATATRRTLQYDEPLNPYECVCSWWHLTRQPGDPVYDPSKLTHDDVYRVKTLPDIDFRDIVAQDATGKGDHLQRTALRHPDNLPRWKRALGELLADVNQQLAERRDPGWRTKGLAYRDNLIIRANECKRLRAANHTNSLRKHEEKRRDAEVAAAAGATVKELRALAGEVAIQRLIDAHGDEFARYLADEYRAVGISLPDRVAKWTRT